MMHTVHELEEADQFEALGGAAKLRAGLNVDDEPIEHGSEVWRIPPAVRVGLAKANAAVAGHMDEEGQRLAHQDVGGGFGQRGIAEEEHLTTGDVHLKAAFGEGA